MWHINIQSGQCDVSSYNIHSLDNVTYQVTTTTVWTTCCVNTESGQASSLWSKPIPLCLDKLHYCHASPFTVWIITAMSFATVPYHRPARTGSTATMHQNGTNWPLRDVFCFLVDLVCSKVVLLNQPVGELEHGVDLLVVGVHGGDEGLVPLDGIFSGLYGALRINHNGTWRRVR